MDTSDSRSRGSVRRWTLVCVLARMSCFALWHLVMSRQANTMQLAVFPRAKCSTVLKPKPELAPVMMNVRLADNRGTSLKKTTDGGDDLAVLSALCHETIAAVMIASAAISKDWVRAAFALVV
jgi:hypothetical protein